MKLHKLSPILCTKDLQKTTAFYENVLGFESRSNFPNFVSLTRGQANIMFVVPQNEPEDWKDPDNSEFFQKPMLTGSMSILIDKVDELWGRCKR